METTEPFNSVDEFIGFAGRVADIAFRSLDPLLLENLVYHSLDGVVKALVAYAQRGFSLPEIWLLSEQPANRMREVEILQRRIVTLQKATNLLREYRDVVVLYVEDFVPAPDLV